MSTRHAPENRFLTAPIGRLIVAQALPMTLVMAMSGLLNVVDAIFLGHFVGPDALAAVSIVFPAVMVTIALASLVGGGMSSLLARHLGAGARAEAAGVFAGAHGLALALAVALIALFFVAGGAVLGHLAGGRADIAGMAFSYLAITICATPVQFLLSIHADAWRNEGRAGLMAVLSVGVTLANIALNFVLIVGLGLGVAGSAWGTALAQAFGLALLTGLRLRGGVLPLPWRLSWARGWGAILALGAPVSLSFIGMALVSATVIATLRTVSGEAFASTMAAYGVVTRVFGFAYLPMMAIALAMQAIVGNNVGAGLRARSDAALRLAVAVAFLYCLSVEALLLGAGNVIGFGFAPEAAVASGVGTILRPMASLYLFTGPVLILAFYFQAVGRPGLTAALTLVKPFVLAPALVVSLGLLRGVPGLWLGFPLADAVMALAAAAIAVSALRRPGAGFGLAVSEGGA